MLKNKMQKALCEQINAEIYSSYLYLAMSAYFESVNLKGFASWMRIQAEEELVHVVKFFDFIHSRNGRVSLDGVAGPPSEWESPRAAFEAAYKHETEITERIHKLVDLALEHSDHPTHQMLQWFVAEQVEEETNADDIVQKLKLVGHEGYGLFMLDRELATRVFTMPAGAGVNLGGPVGAAGA
jgi:ferritin